MQVSKEFFTASSKRIIVHCQDCLEGMANLPESSVDLVVTSPPYNLGIKYSTYNDNQSRSDYLNWIGRWGQVISECLSPEGSLFLNVGSAPKDPFIAMDVARKISACMVLQNTFHWIKSISIDHKHLKGKMSGTSTVSFGHFKPVNSSRYVNDCHEFVFHFTRFGDVKLDRKAIGVPYVHKSNIHRWQSVASDLRCRGNTWFIPYKTITSRLKDRPHPATFPEELVETCIRIHGIERIRQVVDPFLGIGSTALVCVALDLECTGFEIDAEYFAESVRKIENRLIVKSRNLFN